MIASRGSQKYQCLALLLTCFSLTSGSYLGYPRINFAGFFRADSCTRNNNPCNYRDDYNPDNSDFNMDWGFNGTNEFEWFENKVTSVFRQNGTESKDDQIIGKHVMSNLKRPFAKLVDLDTDAQNRSTIYGMKFGIAEQVIDPEENMLFFGNWTPSVIAQDMWSRIACYSNENTGGELYQDTFPFAASGTTVITDIFWDEDIESPVLQELKAAADAVGGTLSVRVSLSYYTRNLPSYVPYNATLGYVMGTIGIPSPTDTLNVGGERMLFPVSESIPVGYEDTLESGDLCYEQDLSQQIWLNKAPFEVDIPRKEVRVDFSNAFTVNLSNTFIDIGSLNLAISSNDGCVQILTNGAIPYLTEDWLQTYSGILTVSLETEELYDLLNNDYALLVVQVYDNSVGGTSNICGDFLSTGATDTANILSHEPEYFIRPMGYYVDRVSKGDTSNITFYVTRYGKPTNDTYFRLVPGASLPENAITPDQYMKQISNGIVEFTFTAVTAPPPNRTYPTPPCEDHPDDLTLPIEGNVYFFGYQHCTSNDTDTCSPDGGDFNYTPTLLFFSDVADVPDDKVNWVDDVGPVLSQFAQVTPIMKTILDMSSYNEVIEPQNRELMKLSLGRAFTDPGYMPVTRYLSPKRIDMILAWLNQDGQPLYDSEGTIPPVESEECVPPPSLKLSSVVSTVHLRCDTPIFANQHPAKLEKYYRELSDPNNPVVKAMLSHKVKGRPLMGLLQFLKNRKEGVYKTSELDQCQQGGVVALREQLQTAMALEFATIPVYLTTLYSIVDGCNQEIYDRIRSVVMQEMVHMAQAGNILIAMGGNPVIDSPDFVPNYPTNLPGDVLPGLNVTLRKLSLQHVKKVLMGIEVPVETEVGDPPVILPPDTLTIGAVYEEISTCIGELGDAIFEDPREDRQVLWPWTPSDELGNVTKVTNVTQAQAAIDMIVAQGEGTDSLDPTTLESNEDLAHFFKFEEVVCGNELVADKGSQTYSYTGDKVPFNANGVWNMRDDPKARDIQPHTNCYVEAKAFHGAFRNLLRNLNEVFNGLPERVDDTVLLMESLQVHAKKTMWTKFTPDSSHTCGPVWDYHWTAGVDGTGSEEDFD